MQNQILLTKLAFSGVFFCYNLLNVLGPSLPESALYYIICCRGTKCECADSLEYTANQTIMFFRTGLGRAAFAFPSQANRTGVRLEANRERPPLQGGSRPADLVRIKVRWLRSHQRNRTGPRDQTRLVRTKCCWCESTNKLISTMYCIPNTNYLSCN